MGSNCKLQEEHANRIKYVGKNIVLLCLITHIIYATFFLVTGFTDLFYLNILFSIPFYITVYFYPNKTSLLIIAVELELAIHQLACNTLLGYESGFYIVLPTILFASFLYVRWKIALFINIILTLSLIAFAFALSEMVPIQYNMHPFELRFLHSYNITVLVIAISFFFYYYIKKYDESIHDLDALNKELNELNLEIVDKNNKISEQNETIVHDNILLSQHKDELTSTVEDLIITRNYLVELNATKDKFFSIIAHDLRGPFVVLMNNSELLEKYFHKISDDEKIKLISLLKNASKSTFSLLENLLLWAQSQRGNIPFVPEAFRLADFVSSNIMILQSQADIKSISITNDIPKQFIINADVEMLNTIIRNLISNSIKFTPQGGSINIGISAAESINNVPSATIFIKDSGIGMDEAVLQKLFTVDRENTRKGTSGESGTGLGLILCKEFVQTHGGEIWAESQERLGSIFYIKLPNVSEQIENIEPVDKTPFEKEEIIIMDEQSKLNILIAEDDPLSGKLMTISVKDISKETSLVRTGMETVDFCKNHPNLDLILMDLKMPGMNGYEATRLIREFNPNIIIIAQTAFGLSGDREKAINAGCNDYISKPIKKTQLMITISQYFSI